MRFQRYYIWILATTGFVAAISAIMVQWHRIAINEQNWWIIVNVVAFDAKYGRFPADVPEFVGFTREGKDECAQVESSKEWFRLIRFSAIEFSDFLSGTGDLVLFRPEDRERQDYVNCILRRWLPQNHSRRHEVRKYNAKKAVRESAFQIERTSSGCGVSTVGRHHPTPIPAERREELRRAASSDVAREQHVHRLASDKNQVMDALLNQTNMPSDYGRTMIELFRDRSQDVYTRDFAVQHIGLYAEALNRRGDYDASSAESASLRRALDEASRATDTIVAAAAFRALADLSAFDPNIDMPGLESRLANCMTDKSASMPARVMAVQICGERKVSSSRQSIRQILDDASSPAVLRKSAECALRCLDGKAQTQ